MKSILIAEGDRAVAGLFTDVFKRNLWSVDSSTDANAAVNALRGCRHYDVVLVSYQVGDTNGVELTRLVRSLEHRKTTPVVMITGGSGMELEAFRAGATDVLHKPIDVNRLLALVGKYARADHQDVIP